MPPTSRSTPKDLVRNAREQTTRLLAKCHSTRSTSAELRLQAQELRARTAMAHDHAMETYLRTSFISVLAEPLPEILRGIVIGDSPMNDDDLTSQARRLNRSARRAKEISREATRRAEKARNQADEAHRRAEQAHVRTEAAHQHAEDVHTQVGMAHRHADDAHQRLKPDDKPIDRQ